MRININKNFEKLNQNYLFSEIALRVNEFMTQNPEKKLISLGIGDVTLPLAPSIASALTLASQKMGTDEGFIGYSDTQGLPALRTAIKKRYERMGTSIDFNDIFVNDGAKSDLANLTDLFAKNEVVIPDPVYPVYYDANVILGQKIRLLPTNERDEFLPSPEKLKNKPYVIYLCSPNNPTGAVFTREQLKRWVDFAIESGSVIIFDSAYESYVSDSEFPRSIFEIKGAKEVAIEVCSLSKTAGFTGVRCGWTVISRENELHPLWKRRQATKFNGASVISQYGALAALSNEGERECKEQISYYMSNAEGLARLLKSKYIYFSGGAHAPYLWVKCPEGVDSWAFFDILLKDAGIICTPGAGFGESGKNFVRLSAFASQENTKEAIERLNKIL